MPEAAHWRAEGGSGAITCELCPHGCRIAPGRGGICRVRRNEGGTMVLPYYGVVTALALDPIEKKPLHHFMPGSEVFSAGFVGCTMRCPFCQNWQISQELPSTRAELAALRSYGPEALVAAALESGAPSVAYTYSEPTVHFEFVLAAMEAARAAGLRNVLVTNGCLEAGPARELLRLTDAANVDLKTWSAEAYEKTLGGRLETVLEFIRIAASLCHLEATTLVVPGLSDSAAGIEGIASFLASLSRDLPLHLSAFHPAWRQGGSPTDPRLIDELALVAGASLRYVYKGNLSGRGADTLCPSCGAVVVGRRGYAVDAGGMTTADGVAACRACGSGLPIVV